MNMQIMGITAESVEQRLAEKAALSEKNEGQQNPVGDDGKGTQTEEENVPFNKHPRFIKLLSDRNDLREAREKDALEIAELKAALAANKKPVEYDPNMPFDVAMRQLKEEAAAEALAAFEEKHGKSKNQTNSAEKLITEGFEYLKDSGYKFTAQDEDTIANIAIEYNINIAQPEDFEKAYKIFDLERKAGGAGRAKHDGTQGGQRATTTTKEKINYSKTDWSNMGERIGARLGL